MNKTKITITILGLTAVSVLFYNQIQQKRNDEALLEQGHTLLLSNEVANENNTIEAGVGEYAKPVLKKVSEVQPAKLSRLTSKSDTAEHLSHTHVEPADHRGVDAPKHHGHEHAQPRRRPEDNSLIPPGEPKKPLPEDKG